MEGGLPGRSMDARGIRGFDQAKELEERTAGYFFFRRLVIYIVFTSFYRISSVHSTIPLIMSSNPYEKICI